MAIEQIINGKNNRDSGNREIVSTVIGCATAASLGVFYGILARAGSNDPLYLEDIIATLGSCMFGVVASAAVNTAYNIVSRKDYSRTSQDVGKK